MQKVLDMNTEIKLCFICARRRYTQKVKPFLSSRVIRNSGPLFIITLGEDEIKLMDRRMDYRNEKVTQQADPRVMLIIIYNFIKIDIAFSS